MQFATEDFILETEDWRLCLHCLLVEDFWPLSSHWVFTSKLWELEQPAWKVVKYLPKWYLDFAKLSDIFHISHSHMARTEYNIWEHYCYLHEGCTVMSGQSRSVCLSVTDNTRKAVAPGEGTGAGGVLRHQDTGAQRLGGEVVVLARLTGVVGLEA